jgi:adenosylcobinamide kinase / adenosylcobinamide-phosphate guanylyltransferase
MSDRRIVFVTGGARSGKSRFAQATVEGWNGPLLYLATAEARDDEMRARIAQHRRERGDRWETLEEPLDLPRALASAGARGVLLDCLTLWASNLLEAYGERPAALEAQVAGFFDALGEFQGRLCLVTNETGLGLVPENPLARRFRDLAGRINQGAAALASEAYLVVSGLPVRLK